MSSASSCALMVAVVVGTVISSTDAYTLYRTYQMDVNQQRRIIQAHNNLRRLEPAANMQEMVWDQNLANLALGHTEICDAWHRPAHQRKGFGYSYIGENIWWSTETWLRSNLQRIIKDFYDEKPFFHFNTLFCQPGEQCGHYTQVVWAQSCAVGCAAAYCNGIRNGRGINHGHVYVCNYGPGGNKPGRQPYIYGQKCSQCPNNGKCYNGLCAPQCAGRSFFELSRPIPKVPKAQPFQPPRAPPPSPVNIPNGLCVDTDSQCAFWSTIGECQRNPAFMNVNCKVSCSQCALASGGSTQADDKPIATAAVDLDIRQKYLNMHGCKDLHYLCPFWSKTNECTLNPSWMLRNCVGSCNPSTCKANTTFSVPASICKDEETSCEAWSGIGECEANPDFMLWKCRKSCGKC